MELNLADPGYAPQRYWQDLGQGAARRGMLLASAMPLCAAGGKSGTVTVTRCAAALGAG
jgi:hypothetical protein